jgi:hypothetical protein
MGTGRRRRTGRPPPNPPDPPDPPTTRVEARAASRPSRVVGCGILSGLIALVVVIGWGLRRLRGPTIGQLRELSHGEPHAAMLLAWTLLCAPIWTSLLIRPGWQTVLVRGHRRAWAMTAYTVTWAPLVVFTPLWGDGPAGLRRDFLEHGYGVAEAMYSGYYAGLLALAGGLAAPLLVLTSIGAMPSGRGTTRALGRAAVAAPGVVALAALGWEWAQTFG